MGHGWGLHGGTWKMGRWGRNILPETLHVLVGYVYGAWATQASKRALGHPPKLDLFLWAVSFEAHVSWHAVFD
jgi:hypothetical protein